jgi:antitoxin CptB
MDSYSKNKLHWKCRRGLLELDLVFQRYLPRVEEKDVENLNELLDLPDNDLWDIVAGRSEDFAPHLREIVAQLRAI